MSMIETQPNADMEVASLALVVDPAIFTARSTALQGRIDLATRATAALDTERAALDKRAQKTLADIDAEHDALTAADLLGKLEVREQELRARLAAVNDLVKRWSLFAESPEVCRGFRAPRFDALAKARRAYDPEGRLTQVRPDPHYGASDDNYLNYVAPGFELCLPVGSTLTRSVGRLLPRRRSGHFLA